MEKTVPNTNVFLAGRGLTCAPRAPQPLRGGLRPSEPAATGLSNPAALCPGFEFGGGAGIDCAALGRRSPFGGGLRPSKPAVAGLLNPAAPCPGFEFGGGAGIRTLGSFDSFAGFQDQCFRPLSHPSGGGRYCPFPVSSSTPCGCYTAAVVSGPACRDHFRCRAWRSLRFLRR